MRVLGIDCGTERTGWGVIDTNGSTHQIVHAGVIRTDNRAPLAARLTAIAAGIRSVLNEHKPEYAAVEEVFHAVNTGSALKLAHVRGVALLILDEARVPTGEYSPAEVKIAVVGHGRASKEQVQLMVQSLLSLERKAAEDASDALAVAICHATRTATLRRMGAVR